MDLSQAPGTTPTLCLHLLSAGQHGPATSQRPLAIHLLRLCRFPPSPLSCLRSPTTLRPPSFLAHSIPIVDPAASSFPVVSAMPYGTDGYREDRGSFRIRRVEHCGYNPSEIGLRTGGEHRCCLCPLRPPSFLAHSIPIARHVVMTYAELFGARLPAVAARLEREGGLSLVVRRAGASLAELYRAVLRALFAS